MMKTKDDDGPTRKIPRGRKRNSSYMSDSGLAKKPTSTSMLQEAVSEGKKSQEADTWFRNSFCPGNKRTSNSPGCDRRWTKPATQKLEVNPAMSDSGILDTSDSLLAELDLDLFDDIPKTSSDHKTHVGSTHGSCGNGEMKNHILIKNEQSTKTSVSLTEMSLKTQIQVNSVNEEKKNQIEIKNDFHEQTAKTPKSVSVTGFSLKDKFKKQMQKNASELTPTRGILGQLREEVMSRARDEAAQIHQKGTDVDIGPFHGLPSKVEHLLKTQRGIAKLYEWQEECLQLPAVLEGKNLIYSLPTSGGKTLVAEILILRELLCKKKDVILVLPFVSIVQEKVRNLSQFAVELNFLVEEYAASKGRFPPTKHRKCSSLYIATIEKAHSLLNSFIELNRMDSLGLVVVDELHMIGEGGSRGATLEAMLLKTLHCGTCQIVGMTATLNNAKDLQVFLHAEMYSNNFRPVKLTECVKVEDNIYTVNEKALCPDEKLQHERVVMFPYSAEIKQQDPDHLLGLVLEVIPDNSCLVFCATKKNCENVAIMLSRLINKHNKKLTDVKKTERKALLRELYKDGEGQICPVLQYTVHFGIAYHHSGLTMDERRLVEDSYSDGTLCLLTCTSTLAAGVNLPAKRVILRSPYVATEFIGHNQYKQMTGRAGRAGIDSTGESILIAKKSDKDKLLKLLTGPHDLCHSSLMYEEGKGIRKLLLSAIGLKIVTSTEDVFTLMEKTLMAVQSKTLQVDVTTVTKNSLQQLIDLKLVIQRKQTLSQDGSTELCLEVTPLGKATFKGSVDIDNSPQLYRDLKKAEESLVLASHLHLLFLITPYDFVNNIKANLPWMVYFKQMNTLSPVELKVASLIGVPESYIAQKASGQSTRQKVDEFVISRFFLTLILYDLWQQRSVWDVSSRFQYPRGFIQNLLSAAASFASCVFHFCQELAEFWAFQDLLGNFVKRLTYCVSMELIPLMEIPGIKLGRARQLYSAGLRTLQAVANADPETLVKKIEHMPRKAARQVVASAKVLLKEKADVLMEEVEDLVRLPEGSL
ncbi:helicase POLQ-like [Gigantopelta aegis]|uniref:helicase POLQ-like n=1 Tax=Gigantopelta aegis TaxID=1735272 RepID=UPI001B88BF79|nr:helicase POLQ-like [Gigantopelta aegis]